MRTLLLTRDHAWGRLLAAVATTTLGPTAGLEVVMAGPDETFPDRLAGERWSVILAALTPWVVPPPLLDGAGLALGFHPGSRDYPGAGCFSFALYEGAAEYGCVCHRLAARPGTGPVVMERRFAVPAEDTLETLQLRALIALADLFREACDRLRAGDRFEPAGRSWSRPPFTLARADRLRRLAADTPPAEVARRKRATICPGQPGPYLELDDEVIEYPTLSWSPLAFRLFGR